ncbi:MAG: IS1634 family transposase [Desulfobacterales bacterium]|nr:IS1634 family transposase [Desulfobacterales bacterium]
MHDLWYNSHMFIREAVKNVKGKKYIQHHLIESVRTPLGPRQKPVLNLGCISLNKDKWKDLANAIESELHKQPRLFPAEPEIEKPARYYAKIIVKERLNKEAGKKDKAEVNKPQYETVDINSLSASDARRIGAEHVALSQMKEYNIDKILKELGFNSNETNYAKMLIAGRLIHPASERETARWVNEDSGIKELLQTDINVYDNALHRTAVLLWEQHKKAEQKLSETARKLFSLKETIILYDLTNTYFEGTKKASRIAKPGKSKERRNDRPLITLALIVDEEGFPKNSRILEGNVSEPDTLDKILDELSDFSDGFNACKTVVTDAGIATEDNLKIIKNKQFRYVAVSRKKSYEDIFWTKSKEREIILADGRTKLTINLAGTEEEAYLLCHSEAKEAKERAIFEKKIKKFEQGLTEMNEGLKRKRTHKKYEKITERIGRLKEKYGVGNLYHIDVRQKEGTVTEIGFRKNPNGEAKEERLGEYVLRTDRSDLTDEEISETHRSLTTLEDSFKCMKSRIRYETELAQER